MKDLLLLLERRVAYPYTVLGNVYADLLQLPLWTSLGVDQSMLSSAAASCAASGNSPTRLESSARLLAGISASTPKGYRAVEDVAQHILKMCNKLRLHPTPPRERINWCSLCHRLVSGYKLCAVHAPGLTAYRRRMRLRTRWRDEYNRLVSSYPNLESLSFALPPHLHGLSLLDTAFAIHGFDDYETVKEVSLSPSPKNRDLFILSPPMTEKRLLKMLCRWLAWERVDISAGKRGPRQKIDIAIAQRLRREDMKLAEIGEHFGISKQAVSKALKQFLVTRQ